MSQTQGFLSRLVRVWGFARKELWSVLRQPRLIMTLVVGPFLILLIFGLGYTEQVQPFRTIIALESEEAQIAADVDDLAESFEPAIDLVGTTTDAEGALAQLEAGDIDLLIIAPDDALAALDRGERANFTVVHSEVDPILRRSIGLISTLSVDEINRRVLETLIGEIQEGSDEVEPPLSGLSAAASGLVDALQQGDEDEARQQREALESAITAAESQAPAGAFYEGVGQTLGIAAGGVLSEITTDLEGADPSNSDALENALAAQTKIIQLESQLNQAQDIDPALLVSPFGSEVQALNDVPDQPAIFYAPGVLMLLIQHLAVTFGALSLVRERAQGATEIFRVSPLSASEAMIGKYIAFVVIVGTVAAALSALMYAFGVPIADQLLLYSGTVLLVILASLGLGFVISGLSNTDSQAIQYAMIVLLVSIFFSGFIIPLDRLLEPVQAVSFLLPATYGISALQDVVFRATQPAFLLIAGLGLYTLAGAFASWL
ncbi:MAG: ABC transporter permease, partial [Actinobacteria bacterium]